MKTLYIVRHAEAAHSSASGDHGRPLTPRGELAELVLRQGVPPTARMSGGMFDTWSLLHVAAWHGQAGATEPRRRTRDQETPAPRWRPERMAKSRVRLVYY